MPRITSGLLPGPAGALEYTFAEPEAVVRRAAVLCHPHPLFGGTLNTRLLFHLSRALVDLGLAVLRFNFRGVGRSEGSHSGGAGKAEDLGAAIAWLQARSHGPLVLGGFSFGAGVCLRFMASAAHPEIERVVLAGLPVGKDYVPSPPEWRQPKLFIAGTQDPFVPFQDLEAFVARAAAPKRLLWIQDGDHYLTGRMDEFRELIRNHLDFEQQQGYASGSQEAPGDRLNVESPS